MQIKDCTFFRTLYKNDSNGYSINLYSTEETITLPDGKEVDMIAAKGYNLPSTASLHFCLTGDWECKNKDGTFQWSFVVENYSEIIPTTKTGIIKWLSTLPGIGKVSAERLYDEFSDNVISIIETEPEKLLTVKGISEKTINKIKADIIERGAGKELYAYLYSFNVPKSKINLIYQSFKEESLDVIKKFPYVLCELSGIGFITADKIATSNGLPRDSYERISAGIYEVLLQAENGGSLFGNAPTGHMCLTFDILKKYSSSLLSLDFTDSRFSNILVTMAKEYKIIIYDNKYFYRYGSAKNEFSTAKKIASLLSAWCKYDESLIMPTILQVAKEELLALASEQMKAVHTSLRSSISIITGGPGTGKTTIERVLISSFLKLKPNGTVCLCAPTGKAANRMSESTGYPATTIHKVLGIREDDAYDFHEIEEDLIIIDEASMLDASLIKKLLDAVKITSQVVFIGDVDQLPSIGAGNVLREMINSKVVPTTRLTQVFRQQSDSAIPLNCKRINIGETKLYYDDSFSFDSFSSSEEISNAACDIFETLLPFYGCDELVVLSPFRKTTESGVDALNKKLKEICNPIKENDKNIINIGKKTFYIGDKVLQTKNCGEITNGDLGYIKDIYYEEGTPIATIEFSAGRIVDYTVEDCQNLDLGYAITVHKSQGSECNIAIIICDPAHKRMLKRNLIYTAVSRAKEKVFFVGNKETLEKGIELEDTSKRFSNLARLINSYYEKERSQDKSEQLKLSI